MIIAVDKDGQRKDARFTEKSQGPFACPSCKAGTILKKGLQKIHHYSHMPSASCWWSQGETDIHRRAKTEIHDALEREPMVKDAWLETAIGHSRPDVQFKVNGKTVAIEVQLSSLSRSDIWSRTVLYRESGVYVLWLIPLRPPPAGGKFSPKAYEKFIHTMYYGRVYYWLGGLRIIGIHYSPYMLFKETYTELEIGENLEDREPEGYSYCSKRWRRPKWGNETSIVYCEGKPRAAWNLENPAIGVPGAMLWTGKQSPWWPTERDPDSLMNSKIWAQKS